MNEFISKIIQGKYIEAELIFEEKVQNLIEDRLQEMREDLFQLNEAPRIRIIAARVRNGKIQRRKKVSNVKGYSYRKVHGQQRLVRMSPMERRNRKKGARRGKWKRKRKMNQIKRKLKRSLNRRKSLGLRR